MDLKFQQKLVFLCLKMSVLNIFGDQITNFIILLKFECINFFNLITKAM